MPPLRRLRLAGVRVSHSPLTHELPPLSILFSDLLQVQCVTYWRDWPRHDRVIRWTVLVSLHPAVVIVSPDGARNQTDLLLGFLACIRPHLRSSFSSTCSKRQQTNSASSRSCVGKVSHLSLPPWTPLHRADHLPTCNQRPAPLSNGPHRELRVARVGWDGVGGDGRSSGGAVSHGTSLGPCSHHC